MLSLATHVSTVPADLKVFAPSVAPDDVIAMKAMANALVIAQIIEPHVAGVLLADPKAVSAMTGLRARSTQLPARLSAAGLLA